MSQVRTQTSSMGQIAEKISYPEFLEKYIDVHAEWVEGEVIPLMTASDRHQDLVRWLIAILSIFVETYDLGWLRSAPFNMHLPHLKRGREPDILFVTAERSHIVQPTYLAEAADLVIEIISPESVDRDRHQKFIEYETAGVPEYWLIEPEAQQAEFYQLDATGQYRRIDLDDGIFRSTVLPDFWLKVAWLWQESLPKVLDVTRELGLI